MSTVAQLPDTQATDLRAQHDALARQLDVRVSIDHFRACAFLGFFGVIAFGMSCKLAWDRWGPPVPGVEKVIPPGGPMFFLIALFVTLVLVAFSVRSYRRYAALAREEAVLFARLKALRAALGFET
jgi:hypothetical protein